MLGRKIHYNRILCRRLSASFAEVLFRSSKVCPTGMRGCTLAIELFAYHIIQSPLSFTIACRPQVLLDNTILTDLCTIQFSSDRFNWIVCTMRTHQREHVHSTQFWGTGQPEGLCTYRDIFRTKLIGKPLIQDRSTSSWDSCIDCRRPTLIHKIATSYFIFNYIKRHSSRIKATIIHTKQVTL